MEVALICSSHMKKVVEEILKSKKLKINNDSNIIFVEKGLENEIEISTFITFDSEDLNSFMIFLDDFKLENNDDIQNMIAVKSNEKFELFPYDKIQYFEADNNDIFCIIENDKTYYKVKDKLYQLEKKLNTKFFIRVSKSSIVNIMSISEILPWFGSKLLLKFKGTNKTVEVTRSYLKRFKSHLGI